MAIPLRAEHPEDGRDNEMASSAPRNGVDEARDAESWAPTRARARRTPKASSKRQMVAAVVRDLNVERGIAVSSDEITAELEARYPGVPFDIGGILGSLTTSGDLIVAFGRPGCCRYAHRDTYTESVPDDEPIVITLRIVEEGCRRLGRDLATKEVTDAMRAAGIRFAHANNYGLLLKNLSQASERGALAWRAPRLASRTEKDAGERSRVYWRLAAAEAPTERSPADRADAAAQGIEQVQALLGHPVARADIALWSATHANAHPVARYLEEHNCLARGLEQLSKKRQARRVTARAGVHVVRTALTVTGGAPVRYATATPTNMSTAMIEFEDRLRLFTPERELASLRALELIVKRGGGIATVLQPIVDLRMTLLYNSVLYYPTTLDHAFPAWALAAELKTVKERVLDWAAELPAMERYRKAMPYKKALEEIDAVELVRRLAPAIAALGDKQSDFPKDLCVVGRGATATHLDLLPYARVAERLTSNGFANPEHCRMLYYDARRVPNPDARWEKNAAGGLVPEDRAGRGWMLVDRVDALGLLWDAVHVPQASAVLSPARALLGYILRDPRPLRDALAITPVAQGAVRRSLVVALGLLGEAVDVDIAIPRSADALDTMAYVLSTVLVAPDRARVEGAITAALERLQAAERTARVDGAAARKVLTQASRRVASGMWLSVVG